MFVQKLALDPSESYCTTATVENLVENIHLSYKHVPILCLSSKDSWPDNKIAAALKKPLSAPTLTVKQYNYFKEHFDSTHAIFPEAGQAHEFGYSLEDIGKPVITMDLSCGFQKIQLCKFFIRAEKNDRFVALYILAQQFTLAIFTKQPERMKMFCRIFNINADIHDYTEEKDSVEEECAVFLDGYSREVHAERVMIIGNGNTRIQELHLDLSVAGKYKYRILDIARRLSPNVVKRAELFNYDLFKNINK